MLDTAARIFYERGYANASVQDVAEALGILKGSLYHYIDTKEDLLFRLLDETQDEVHGILEEIDALEHMDPLVKLRLYVRRQIEFNMDNLVRVSVYYHELDHLSPAPRGELLARRRMHEQFVTALVREAQERGRVDPRLDAEGASRCIFATIIWTYRWYSPERDDRAHIAETCAAFAVNGLAAGRLDHLPSGR